MTNRVLGIIPARGGSKRVPRKNIRTVGSKPLLAHTIEQANTTETLDKVIVSTEDDEILEIAREWDADVPFERPERLASDDATNNQVVEHALNWFSERGETFETVCLLSVTTPLRDVSDIDNAVRRLDETGGESVISIAPYDSPPFWAVRIDESGKLSPYFGDDYLWSVTQTQDVPDLCRPNSSIYVATVEAFREHNSFYTNETYSYIMPRERSVDIDEQFDLQIVDALLTNKNQ
jgi:CMP-N-acetylneuraminic acid synthetase